VKLKTKLFLIFTSTSILIIFTFGTIIYKRLWNEQLALIQANLSQQLQNFDFSLKNFFAEVEGDVNALAQNEVVRSRDDSQFTSFLQANEKNFRYNYSELEKKIIRIFNAYRLTHPYVNSVYMGRENGSMVRSHPWNRPIRYDPRQRPWYILGKKNPARVVTTEAYPSLTTSDINLGFEKALLDEKGRVYGVVGIDVTLVNLTDYMVNFQVRPAGTIFLVDRNGVIMASQAAGLQGRKIGEYAPALPSLLARDEREIAPIEIRGRRHFLFHRKFAEQDWRIVVLIPAANIEKMIGDHVLWMVLSLCLGLALLSLLTLSGLHLFVIHPLKKLTEGVDFITRTGDLGRRIGIASRDELGTLASSFDQMVATLEESQRSLQVKEKVLTEYRDHLEELVRQRTRELEATLGELAVAKEKAEAADRLKSAFLATMSHELRTPLNSIIGFTGIILQELAGPLNEEQRKQLGMVRDSSRHLLALINDVLDISKIEAEQLEIRNEPFDLRASILKVAGIVRPLAEKKQVDLRLEIAAEIGRFSSDSRRVEQVLLNLLNNAIKFTERGWVQLTAALAAEGNGTAVRISVADTGIGIKAEDLGKLFQPFRQIDSGLARQHEGTGLGLVICRRLAGLLGGEIRVTSELGKGSVFTFILPVPSAETP